MIPGLTAGKKQAHVVWQLFKICHPPFREDIMNHACVPASHRLQTSACAGLGSFVPVCLFVNSSRTAFTALYQFPLCTLCCTSTCTCGLSDFMATYVQGAATSDALAPAGGHTNASGSALDAAGTTAAEVATAIAHDDDMNHHGMVSGPSDDDGDDSGSASSEEDASDFHTDESDSEDEENNAPNGQHEVEDDEADEIDEQAPVPLVPVARSKTASKKRKPTEPASMPKSASKKKRSSVASTPGSKSSAVTVASVKENAPAAAEKSKAKKRGRKVDVPPLTKVTCMRGTKKSS